jgi:hypothetical protein
MKAHQENMVTVIKISQERMRAEMKAHQERMAAKMEAWLGKVGSNQEKLGVKMEANQEKVEGVVEPYGWVLHVKTTHLLTAPQYWTSNVLHGVPEGATYEETNGDRHLSVGYHSQLKTWTPDSGEHLQEFATAIKQLTHCPYPAVHENHMRRGLGKAWVNRIGD